MSRHPHRAAGPDRQRAATLAAQAVQAGQPWVRRLGRPPTVLAQPAAWEHRVRRIAAYRDRCGITGSDPLGATPNSQGQRLDHQHVDAAARQAHATAAENRRRPGPQPLIDSDRDLSR